MSDVPETLPLDSPSAPPPLLVGRYRVGPLIGRGGSGRVHRALDTFEQRDVAVKFAAMTDERARLRNRRERVALRRLRLPGVVRMLDDGDDGRQSFLVMELVEGGPFSRLAGPWPSFAPQLERLLTTLSALHGIGVVHRDLKPGNVLLDADRQPVIMDFGLALGSAVLGEVAPPVEGTPRYLAPEQLRGAHADARADLYAVGVMVWELLAGRRFGDPGPPPQAPEPVLRAIAALVAPDPADRPATAQDALASLGLEGPVVPRPAKSTPAAIRALFAEDRRTFLHVGEDAVALVRARAGEDPDRVQAELAAWVARGEAWVEDGKIALTRENLEWLRLSPADLEASSVPVAVRQAATQIRRGQAGPALAGLQAVAPLLPEAAPGIRRRWAEELVWAALLQERIAPLQAARYALDRQGDRGAAEVGLLLLDAARAAWEGELDRADDLLERPRPPLTEPMEQAWEGLRVRAAARRGLAAHRARVEELARWGAGGPRNRMAIYQSMLGDLAYREERYGDAASHHEEAAALRRGWPYLRASSLQQGAGARLDELDLEGAVRQGRAAAGLARRIRAAMVEAGARWVEWTARYRLGQPVTADARWAEAAAAVSRGSAARFGLLCAVVAWRAGRACTDVAERGHAAFRADENWDGVALCAALVARDRPDRAAEARPLLPRLLPEIGLQCAALLALAGVDAGRIDWVPRITRPRSQWATRLDVLSIAEALEALR